MRRWQAGATGFVVGAVTAGFVVSAVVADVTAPHYDVAPVSVEFDSSFTQVDACRALAFNLAGEVTALYGLASQEQVDADRLDAHAANWADKVTGLDTVCGVELSGGPGA